MPPRKKRTFDVQAFLESTGLGKQIVTHDRAGLIFSQGDPCRSVMYLRRGEVQLSVLSHSGKEAILATLGVGAFVGEAALTGHPVRLETAKATMSSELIVVSIEDMNSLLTTAPEFATRFITHLLTRNARLEADLVDQLFNSSEKRLARILLLLARYGEGSKPMRLLPTVSQEALAEMIGTTRSRVNVFLNRFRKLGFIDYDADGLTINPSLLTVVVRD